MGQDVCMSCWWRIAKSLKGARWFAKIVIGTLGMCEAQKRDVTNRITVMPIPPLGPTSAA
jgi:hypothetical protein